MPNIVDISCIHDYRGGLSFVEELTDVPFKIKRVYWIYDTQPNITRGEHAHKKLTQLLVCISGAVTVELDDGKNKESVVLNSPSKGLIIKNMIWRSLKNFASGTIVLVLASEIYSEDDYYRTYESFLNACAVS